MTMPDGLARLRTLEEHATGDEALALFDALPAVTLPEMLGSWNGSGLRTGHVFDGVLEDFGWRGKDFRGPQDVDPLVFERQGKEFRVNPALVPIEAGARHRKLFQNRVARRLSHASLPLLRTSKTRARLRMVEYRGVVTGSMVYDALPIIDHFRLVDADTLLGAMDLRGLDTPFLFVLRRRT